MPCLHSWRHYYQVAFVTEVVIALHYISAVGVDSQVLVHLSTVTQWLPVLLPVLEGLQVVT